MLQIIKKCTFVLDLPKTIYFNFKVFPFHIARKLPVAVSRHVQLQGIRRNCVQIESTEKRMRFMVRIGMGGTMGIREPAKSLLDIGKGAKIRFYGKAALAKGISLRVRSGLVEFGRDFSANCDCMIICKKYIRFGDEVLIGWNTTIRDCDGHDICNRDGIILNPDKEVVVGEGVWIGSDVKLFKGCTIPDGSIIAGNSCVTKSFDEKNILIGGYPAKVLRRDVIWKR